MLWFLFYCWLQRDQKKKQTPDASLSLSIYNSRCNLFEALSVSCVCLQFSELSFFVIKSAATTEHQCVKNVCVWWYCEAHSQLLPSLERFNETNPTQCRTNSMRSINPLHLQWVLSMFWVYHFLSYHLILNKGANCMRFDRFGVQNYDDNVVWREEEQQENPEEKSSIDVLVQFRTFLHCHWITRNASLAKGFLCATKCVLAAIISVHAKHITIKTYVGVR